MPRGQYSVSAKVTEDLLRALGPPRNPSEADEIDSPSLAQPCSVPGVMALWKDLWALVCDN